MLLWYQETLFYPPGTPEAPGIQGAPPVPAAGHEGYWEHIYGDQHGKSGDWCLCQQF